MTSRHAPPKRYTFSGLSRTYSACNSMPTSTHTGISRHKSTTVRPMRPRCSGYQHACPQTDDASGSTGHPRGAAPKATKSDTRRQNSATARPEACRTMSVCHIPCMRATWVLTATQPPANGSMPPRAAKQTTSHTHFRRRRRYTGGPCWVSGIHHRVLIHRTPQSCHTPELLKVSNNAIE